MRRFLDAGVMIPNGAKKVNTFLAEKLSKSGVENLLLFQRCHHRYASHFAAKKERTPFGVRSDDILFITRRPQ